MSIHVPAEPFHPGEYIADELNARSMTQEDLAEITGITRRQIVNLIQGKSGITPETAIALAAAFGDGHTAMGWMNLQAAYELALAAQNGREVERRAALFKKVPVRELGRRGWIPDDADIVVLEQSICKILQVKSINDPPAFNVAARKSTTYATDTGAQLIWYGRAMQLAECAPASRYDSTQFESNIRELLKLAANPEDVRRVPKVLGDMGIRLVFVQHLQKTKIDGVAFWLDGKSPAIAMSLRFDRIDNFWFTLLHECIHIKHTDVNAPIDVDVASSQRNNDLPEIELRANQEAADYLVPKADLDDFIKRAKPLYYESKIVGFAGTHGVHPGIVVGQLHNHPNSGFEYTHLRKYLAKIHQFARGNAITDGWGNKPEV